MVEASGIARSTDRVHIVGDDSPGVFWTYELQPSDQPTDSGTVLSEFEIFENHVVESTLPFPLAMDLEAIEVLADGSLVFLSERLRILFTTMGLVWEYSERFAEIGSRGLEGLAARTESDSVSSVAAVWEGGFPQQWDVPEQLENTSQFVDRALNPVVCVQRLVLEVPGWRAEECRFVELQVPIPPDSAQRFRAPDLVWYSEGNELLVLLSSQNTTTAPPPAFKYKWLQRFDLQGRRLGAAINLCDAGALPSQLQQGRSGNVEGMDWFEEERSLIVINDWKDGEATAAIIAIPSPWPMTTSDATC